MPPHAGMDEIFHVARLAFVAQEHRNPAASEPSIPPYIDGSLDQKWDSLPAFTIAADHWTDVVRANPHLSQPHPLTPDRLKPYGRANYEAQQPSAYYSAFAWMHGGTDTGELWRWRLLAVLCGLIVVLATAVTAERWFSPRVAAGASPADGRPGAAAPTQGTKRWFGVVAGASPAEERPGAAAPTQIRHPGLLAAALIVSLPTWLTLIVRAGNDAPACALVAIAIAITAAAPQRIGGFIAEGFAWALALAVKLYTWPVAIVAAVLWRKQRAPRTRIVITIVAAAIGVAITLADLHARTHNPLGIFPFDKASGKGQFDVHFDVAQIIKITVATAAWTSGHRDALRPLAIVLYIAPIIAALLCAQRKNSWWRVAAIALATFGAAQLFAGITTVLRGHDLQVGKEGWYWYVLIPIVAAALFPPMMRSRWRFASAGWLVAWDLLITECQLFHDYAGMASAGSPSMFFRWGPLHAPFTADLANIAVGPLATSLVALRLAHLSALAALFILESLFARELI